MCARAPYDGATRWLAAQHSLTRSWGSCVRVCSQIDGRYAIKAFYSYPEQVHGAQVAPAHLQ